jgi:carbon-monoxide dehydrogenase medium subunit
MTPFELVEPRSLQDAVALLDLDDPSVRPIAGGTALMLMMKAAVFRPTRLVSLRGIEPRYSGIEAGKDGALRIGAMTTLAAVEHSALVEKSAPVITRTARTLANVRVRNVATVGGALAHGDPHMDLPPVLMALGARLSVTGQSGARELAVEDLYAGYYETVLQPGELIAEVAVPAQSGRRSVYLKVTTRAAHDWPAVGIAVSLGAGRDGKADPRIVISAATEKAMRLPEAEAALAGGLDEAGLKRASEAAADTAPLMTDAQGSAAYKKQLVRVYVERALRQALGSGNGSSH